MDKLEGAKSKNIYPECTVFMAPAKIIQLYIFNS